MEEKNEYQQNKNHQSYNNYQNYPNTQKSRIAAGLLAFFLGSIGIHNFYLGYTTKGVIQLLLVILTCGIGGFITAIWSFVECILIFSGSISVDGKGILLRD